MKVIQVCIGRFHHFDLAKQLARHGVLGHFFTGYPFFKLKGQGLPMDKITSFPWLMAPRMALQKWMLSRKMENVLHQWAQEALDYYVASKLPECDILLALSGSGLRAGHLAQQRGGVFVCDRGSSHISYQDAILREEFERWGNRFAGIDSKTIDIELAEYDQADLITVPSTFVYRSFVGRGVPEAKLRLVPYGVDLSRFEKVSEPNNRHFDVLFVGQVSFRKGIPDLLNAFDKFRHRYKRLRIVGGMQQEMKGYLTRNPPKIGVEFLGHIPQPRLKEIMSRSHVMVLPSIEEGLALVQAQAMACGCPVIGTWHTGAEDLFTDGIEGFIVPPRDPAAIAERLQFLADHPDIRNSMGEAALRKVNSIGGWDRYGDVMVSVLRELVART